MNRRTLLTSAAPVIALSGLIVGCSVLTETTTNGVPVEMVEETVLRLAKEFANGPAAA